MVQAPDGGADDDGDDFTGASGGGDDSGLITPFADFLEKKDTIGNLIIVDLADPITLVGGKRAAGLIGTIVGSIWVAFTAGVNQFIGQAIGALLMPLLALQGFIVETLSLFGSRVAGGATAAWYTAGISVVGQFGISRFFVALAITFATLYVLGFVVRSLEVV